MNKNLTSKIYKYESDGRKKGSVLNYLKACAVSELKKETLETWEVLNTHVYTFDGETFVTINLEKYTTLLPAQLMKALERRRADLGLSKHALCQKAGIHHSTYHKMLNKGIATNLNIAYKLCEAVDIEIKFELK
tara:strand:+ start:13514 stop:13915 length:402 start_codon:yes stop_codon:yes gene_type:complete